MLGALDSIRLRVGAIAYLFSASENRMSELASMLLLTNRHKIPIVIRKEHATTNIKSKEVHFAPLFFILSLTMKSTTAHSAIPMKAALLSALAMAWAWGVIAGSVGEL